MKRGKMQKKIFRFLDRLPYFPFYSRTIVLNVKVKIANIFNFLPKVYESAQKKFKFFVFFLALGTLKLREIQKQRRYALHLK